VVRSGAVAERHLPNFRLRLVVGDDGGTERSGSGATLFRTFDLGRRLGTMVVRSEAIAERHLSELSTQGGWWGKWRYSGA
jgi:hypothetical protein